MAEAIWLRSKDRNWKRLSRTLAKGFVAVFAVGAATGTASEFGLVLLWPNLTEAAGRYIYFPLYMEIFAFIMEGAFIYLYYYAAGKMSPRIHLVVGLLAMIGAWYSASMILSVNSFMQSPANVMANYDPSTGSWAPPDVILYVPTQIAQALDPDKLSAVGIRVFQATGEDVVVSIPSGIVRALMAESFSGKTVAESTLAAVATPEAAQAIGSVPVKTVVDQIVANTVRKAGVFQITFLSGGYLATLLHALGAAVTVSSFTVAGAYALRILRSRPDDPDSRYFRKALKFASAFALVAVALQGTALGHAMGAAVAKHNPEKFAAMEGTSSQIVSLPDSLGLGGLVRGMMPLLSYGRSDALIPSYDAIDPGYRPPLLVHYMYYVKIGLGVLLGLIGLVLAASAWRGSGPRWVLWLAVASPALAQLVSFLGWGTRELGRKPWAIYGIMDVQTELTINPPPAWQLAAVAVYLALMLALLLAAVYVFLWRRR